MTFTISQENFSCNVNTFKMTLQSSGWGLNICYLVENACCVRFEAIAFNHLWAYITHNAPLQRSYFTQMHFKHWQMLHLHPHGRSLPNRTLNAQINNDGESHTGMCKATTRFSQVLQIANKDDNNTEMKQLAMFWLLCEAATVKAWHYSTWRECRDTYE